MIIQERVKHLDLLHNIKLSKIDFTQINLTLNYIINSPILPYLDSKRQIIHTASSDEE